ncbi:hypothetical protein G6F62_012153 [Rhizopus arrhizus]|nr:hypothetical protein G6F62_012153 [Rhizopus arrhizus]
MLSALTLSANARPKWSRTPSSTSQPITAADAKAITHANSSAINDFLRKPHFAMRSLPDSLIRRDVRTRPEGTIGVRRAKCREQRGQMKQAQTSGCVPDTLSFSSAM